MILRVDFKPSDGYQAFVDADSDLIYFVYKNTIKQEVIMIYYNKVAHTNKVVLEYGYEEMNQAKKNQKRIIDKQLDSDSDSDSLHSDKTPLTTQVGFTSMGDIL